LNIEHRILLRMAPDYDHLTLMQKVEVFEHAVNNTAGDDLAKLLWLKSPSSEVRPRSPVANPHTRLGWAYPPLCCDELRSFHCA
ncbi:hypothetical protein OFB93_30575, partial [Escherichia coli]|nr:hypothetical protein [Escherichia coli]